MREDIHKIKKIKTVQKWMKYELLLRTKMVLILFKRFWNLKFSSQNPLKKLWIKEKNNKKASSPLLSKYCIVECFNYWIIINVTYWLFWSVLVGISVRTKEQMKSPWSYWIMNCDDGRSVEDTNQIYLEGVPIKT